AGSERHMMQSMFTSNARPFYNSASIMELKAISMEAYIPFIVNNFRKREKEISEATVERIHNLFQGHTYYVQKTFNEAFTDTLEGEECTISMLKEVIDNMIMEHSTIFREILSNIPENRKALLYAIAIDGLAEKITSSEFIKRHNLPSASSVQASIKKLLDSDLVTEVNKSYQVTDKLFSMWINNMYGKPFEL
ncbi:MAG: ATPase, partial [Bacteroidales bacterium]